MMAKRIAAMQAEAAKAAKASGDDHDTPPPPPQARAPRPQREPYTAQGEWDPKTPRYGLTEPFMSNWTIPFTKLSTGVPCFEPPYGKLAVIDLNTGKLLWSKPIGTMEKMGPFGIGLPLPFDVGTPIYGGTMTTRAGLIFQVGSMDETMRAVDVRTGKVLWKTKMPGTANSTPITYVAPQDGKQYVVASIPNPGFVYPRAADAKPTDDEGGWVIGYALP